MDFTRCPNIRWSNRNVEINWSTTKSVRNTWDERPSYIWKVRTKTFRSINKQISLCFEWKHHWWKTFEQTWTQRWRSTSINKKEIDRIQNFQTINWSRVLQSTCKDQCRATQENCTQELCASYRALILRNELKLCFVERKSLIWQNANIWYIEIKLNLKSSDFYKLI